MFQLMMDKEIYFSENVVFDNINLYVILLFICLYFLVLSDVLVNFINFFEF